MTLCNQLSSSNSSAAAMIIVKKVKTGRICKISVHNTSLDSHSSIPCPGKK